MQKILGGGSYTCYCSYWSWGGCGCEHVDTDDLGIDVGSYIAQFCRGSSNCTLHDPYGGCVGTCL
ncbi:hypothetical protein LJC57_02725 [Parabacteroides sp. OttesenSCG-928-G07]|nr:hypothetical protein [Parabacteroides sp. OttesenSCG-928-G07]